MQCPICGAMELETYVGDIPHTHKGCVGSIRKVLAILDRHPQLLDEIRTLKI